MKDAIVLNEKVTCYQDADLADPTFQSVCTNARTIWAERCKEYLANNGDIGSAVIGAGFSVWYPQPPVFTHYAELTAVAYFAKATGKE